MSQTKSLLAKLRQLFKNSKDAARTDSPAKKTGLDKDTCDRYMTMKKRDGSPLMAEI